MGQLKEPSDRAADSASIHPEALAALVYDITAWMELRFGVVCDDTDDTELTDLLREHLEPG
ncbi:hypothetical protein [Specibacter sp. RAF43]|uniref:hypothetical protein n=1 Tax=Specibacter sp. RAF43 TaxID=3233057 RepID=UPI003F961EC8